MTNLGFLIWAIPLLIILSSAALIVAAKQRWPWLPLSFLAFLTMWAMTGSEIIAYTSGIFGVGSMLSMLVVPLSCLALIVFIVGGIRLFVRAQDVAAHPQWHRVYYAIGALLIVGLSIWPLMGSRRIHNRCNRQNREVGDIVIVALTTYEQAHNQYPKKLDVLVPDYLPDVPTLQCFEIYEKYDPGHYVPPIEIVACSDDITVLSVPDLSNSFPQRYNLTTGEWSKVSFLDGVCSHLE